MTLQGHWPLTEDSGDALDYSGNENHGTVNGATQGASGILGSTAYSFDGTNDQVNIETNLSDITGGWPLTISVWHNLSDQNSEVNLLAEYDGSGFIMRYRYDQSPPRAELYSDNGYMIQQDASSYITYDEWINTTIVVDNNANESRWYVNGNLEHTGSIRTFINSSETLSIAFRGNGTDTLFFTEGEMSHARVYSRALTLHEIQYLYQVSQQGYALTEEL